MAGFCTRMTHTLTRIAPPKLFKEISYSKELEFVIIIIIVVTSKEKLISTGKKCTRDRDERFRKSR